ncbi:uncharacterized protein LOC142551340 isoform X1 [Primulina tabacum]|uniref:uncharacterized protein LOC142551340 isoform X1 n=1 Tax=Primulina tabacum TaxID=48773 RepID=UPI003F59075E
MNKSRKMELTSVGEGDIVIDIETCVNSSKEVMSLEILDGQLENVVSFTVCGMPMVVDELVNGEISVSLPINVKNVSEISSDLGKSAKKDSRKSTSAKKPPKPPRPPRSLLDAADQKLITEMAELAMIKRARMERMKVLKKMKAAKASSSASASASSSGNLVALLFTVLFCIVVIFKGCHLCHSSGMHPKSNTTIHIHGSSESNSEISGNNIVVQVQNRQNLFTSNAPLLSSGSPLTGAWFRLQG